MIPWASRAKQPPPRTKTPFMPQKTNSFHTYSKLVTERRVLTDEKARGGWRGTHVIARIERCLHHVYEPRLKLCAENQTRTEAGEVNFSSNCCASTQQKLCLSVNIFILSLATIGVA